MKALTLLKRYWALTLPVWVLIAGIHWVLVPLWESGQETRAAIVDLQTQMAELPAQRRVCDSLESLGADLRMLEQRLRVGASRAMPGPDSIADLARAMGLTVGEMEVAEQERSGPHSLRRMRLVVDGDPRVLAAYLDSLRTLSPRVRMDNVHWVRGDRGYALRPLELRLCELGQAHLDSAQQNSLLPRLALAARAPRFEKVDGQGLEKLFGAPTLVAPASLVPAAGGGKRSTAPLAPALTITGIVAGRLANCVDARGTRVMLKPGGEVNGWIVRSIDARAVTLERDGKTHVIQGR